MKYCTRPFTPITLNDKVSGHCTSVRGFKDGEHVIYCDQT